MRPIAAIQLPAMRTATRDHAVVAEVDDRRAHQCRDQTADRGDAQDEQVHGGVRRHGAPVLVAVADPEHGAERDQHGQRQAQGRRDQQAEHDERGGVQEGHGRKRRRPGAEPRSDQQGKRKHQHEPAGGALTLLPSKEARR